jgi:sec-independent protein translocase protein TatC
MQKERKDHDLSYFDHLEILRKKILAILAVLILFSAASFFFTGRIVELLLQPLSSLSIPLNYFKPYEKFLVYMKIAFLMGLVLTLPFAFYQLASFVSPALKKEEKGPFITAIILVPAIFLGGAYFAYSLIVPAAFRFFVNFGASDHIKPLWSMQGYFEILVSFLMICGFVFQAPMILLLLIKLGIFSVKTLSHYRRHIIVAIAVISGIFSPPDILSQLLVGVPLYILFELTLIIGRFLEPKRNKKLNLERGN